MYIIEHYNFNLCLDCLSKYVPIDYVVMKF